MTLRQGLPTPAKVRNHSSSRAVEQALRHPSSDFRFRYRNKRVRAGIKVVGKLRSQAGKCQPRAWAGAEVEAEVGVGARLRMWVAAVAARQEMKTTKEKILRHNNQAELHLLFFEG